MSQLVTISPNGVLFNIEYNRAGEIESSVFLEQLDVQEIEDLDRKSEDQQDATLDEHKVHEIPFEDESTQSPASLERQTIRKQCKLEDWTCQKGGMQSSSSGYRNMNQQQNPHDSPRGSSGQGDLHGKVEEDKKTENLGKTHLETDRVTPQGDPVYRAKDPGTVPARGKTQKGCRRPSVCKEYRLTAYCAECIEAFVSSNAYSDLVHCLRATWMTGKTRPKAYRVSQLEALCHFLDERQADIQHALCADLRKPCFETELTEVLPVRNELAYALNNLNHWMRDECVHKNLATLMDCAFIRKEPYGVVLIIGAYNYPIHLTLMPLVGAIAAGNCVVLKPSEVSSCTEALLAKALPCYMDPESPDYARMVNDRHFKRAQAFLESGHVAIGGETDESELYIAPTVLVNVKEWDPVMQEEIFSPILPIFIVRDVDEAIDFINCRERPLALYAFSSDSKVVHHVLDNTSSGSFCGNDTMLQALSVALPFGGVGMSGFGKYHGKFTFDTFTHFRGCLLRSMGMEMMNRLRYPPYNNRKLRAMRCHNMEWIPKYGSLHRHITYDDNVNTQVKPCFWFRNSGS
ncbi:PREDICTED: aldehyde dehydrogenase family 3 member B1-like [Thamnophis sirtalis]|uniref:Aldehyde dehydrogenase family 3 member B1-like n=1 Tax=Thamnophis sirtalis TaxID=35019 RepID=A0A6I9XCX8_9SAUR|nr:PREDICTED: aldehyde dehydrogenase family 3 member B1-like [Thamnophis sirtalis]